MTRIIIAGSRNFDDYDYMCDVCDDLLADVDGAVEFISGGCKGADRLGEEYAEECGCDCTVFKADWNKYGAKAGPIRNRLMAEYATEVDRAILIAFPIGESVGTRDMIQTAEKFGMEVHVYEDFE